MSSLPEDSVKLVEFSEEIKELRDNYIENKVLGVKSLADAEHVATATVANVDFIISWNFKHIVHFEKISGFNSVNLNRGYKMINIFSPRQVV